ncbi:exodeoxyribonuclease VII large subunit [Testudinibacter aquarius]|uniref:Exodeoxyribonuclease 7 large subunit n=1 Tax=Testudinibacter aquarius TaxID=1524974 RepID=A0A4R3XWS9_9PAST|nr:exodeoxyribonuclease VII large subunit [Testudinibacter aquarius]KAE9528442.1 exodeoxyribonuclease VII large subunit [Testudinibacter aquarius]TCV84205.1 exodeoxyribonuclease VII large subunit [Testudinibacter aquarius]TNG92571.1 exodeoxyribonuclease VII large subunit [Testudinibacter aquarius]
MQNTIYSVSQLNQTARLLLEEQLGHIWLTGEISNFSQPVSGHWYLSLKDENAQLRCAMFRMKNSRVGFRPQNGMQVLVRGTVSLYEPRGDYQLIIDSMQPAGDGLLQQQFEQLKQKLAAEGLFAQQLKKPIPHFNRRIGIVTSKSGAALQDILQVLQRRDPSLEVVIYPTQVQGKDATAEIVQMIELANIRQEADVLIVGRGGGSLEDLWCFNEEAVARAIFASQIPIISAVGHETDVTIADFVADLRAPTPSAAAAMVSRDHKELLQRLQYSLQHLEMAFDRLFNRQQQRLERLRLRLANQHPSKQLAFQRQQSVQLLWRLKQALTKQLDRKINRHANLQQRLQQNPLRYPIGQQQQHLQQWKVRLATAIEKNMSVKQYQFSGACAKLNSLSPLNVLARGYSISQNAQGKAIVDSRQLHLGDNITTRFSRGAVVSRVIDISPDTSDV